MKRIVTFLSAIVALLALISTQASAKIWYVSPSGTGNGSSWSTTGSLQTILTGALSGDQVWALKGVYIGNFTATDGVTVYGSFAGTETSPSQRNISRNASILDASGTGTVYAVPSAAVGTNTLNGFTIEGGTNRGIFDPASDKLVVAYCTISGNTIQNASGAGAYVHSTTAMFSNCTFLNNSFLTGNAQVWGGGLYTDTTTTATITSCTFSGNNADNPYNGNPVFGGGVFTNGPATVTDCTFTGNSTNGQGGGGMYGNGPTVNVSGCTFTSNSGCAFAAYGPNTVTTLTNTVFNGNPNRAVNLGGTSSTISGCTFESNSFQNYMAAAMYDGSVQSSISNCTFDNNNITSGNTEYGGALYIGSGTSVSVTFCAFTNNTMSNPYNGNPDFGGAIAAFGNPYIADCTFSGNVPSAVDLENTGFPGSPAYIIDSLITGTGTTAGNAINLGIQGGTTTYVYAVVSNNDITNANAAINIGSTGALSVANNIFYGNNGAVNDNNSSATFVSSHNDFWSNTYKYQGSGITTSSTDLNVNPLFVTNPNFTVTPINYGNLEEQSGSPMIDAGDDSYVSEGDTDVNGSVRIQGSHVDIGCYEHTPSSTSGHLTSLSHASLQAGHSAFTLYVFGTGFVSGATVNWNGTPLTSTFVSTTELSAVVPSTDLATAGTASVTEVNPAAAASNALTFTITPATTLTSISPSTIAAGSPSFTLTVTGAYFVSGGTVYWNGVALTTTFISSTSLTATVPASDVSSVGSAAVTVGNPNVAQTAAKTFTITVPAPTITSISPSSAPAGSSLFILTVKGTNYTTASVVKWNGVALQTAYFNSTVLGALVPATDLATAGTAHVTVTNSGAAASNAATFTITAAAGKAR